MTFSPSPGGFGAKGSIHPFSEEGMFRDYIALHGLTNVAAAWPAANRALYMPIYLPGPTAVTHFWWANGNVKTANVDMGIFTEAGTKIVSTGSTAMAGADFAIQTVASAFTLSMGCYYIGMSVSNNTANPYCMTAYTVAEMKWAALAQEAAALPLPSTATFAVVSSAYVPFAGVLYQ